MHSSRLTPLTLLHIMGEEFRETRGYYLSSCSSCGDTLAADRDYFYCLNDACDVRISSPVDYLSRREGLAATKTLLSRAGRHFPESSWETFLNETRVTRWWRKAKNNEAVASQLLINSLKKHGLSVPPGNFCKVLNATEVRDLFRIGRETGALVPYHDSLEDAYLAIAYQTLPTCIDRIELISPTNERTFLLWNDYEIGVSGMLDMVPRDETYLFAHPSAALKISTKEKMVGRSMAPFSVTAFDGGDHPKNVWLSSSGDVCLVLRQKPDARTFNLLARATSRRITACLESSLLSMDYDSSRNLVWPRMKTALVKSHLVSMADDVVDSEAADMLSWMDLDQEDGAKILAFLEKEGKLRLSRDIKEFLSVTEVSKSPQITVKETSRDYIYENSSGEGVIANFVFKPKQNIFMRATGEVYHRGDVIFGDHRVECTIPSSCLDSPRHLQDAIREEILRSGAQGDALPTVVHTTHYRRYISHYLRGKVGRLPSIEGVDSLGWSQDKRRWVAPGKYWTKSAGEVAESYFTPGKEVLRVFCPGHVWDSELILQCDEKARELISVHLAQVVRSYLGCSTGPLFVKNTTASRQLLRAMFQAIGQDQPYELNINARDNIGVDGITGYPLLVSGYTKAQGYSAKFSHTLLGEEGHDVADKKTEQQLRAAATTFQFALTKVVEWCLESKAEGFSEQPAFDRWDSLVREGSWLMRNVCEAQPWEVRVREFKQLETILSGIDKADTSDKIYFTEDLSEVEINLRGTVFEDEKLRKEMMELGVEHNLKGVFLQGKSVQFLPILKSYLGEDLNVNLKHEEALKASSTS